MGKSLSLLEEPAYTDDEPYFIDKYWNMVSREMAAIIEARDEGLAEEEIMSL